MDAVAEKPEDGKSPTKSDVNPIVVPPVFTAPSNPTTASTVAGKQTNEHVGTAQ